MRRVALCLHDVRLSGENASVELIESVRKTSDAPLTIHLVVDAPVDPMSLVIGHLRDGVARGRMEVVFHGLTHRSPVRAWDLLAWYHRHEAEYIVDDAGLRERTAAAYESLSDAMGSRLGICPSCWLATKANRAFLSSLSSGYEESLFAVKRNGCRAFSPLIPLGSSHRAVLPPLRTLARAMTLQSLVTPHAKTRIVVHPCDTANPRSMRFLMNAHARLLRHEATPVLMRDLL